jgi:hypothetical protein
MNNWPNPAVITAEDASDSLEFLPQINLLIQFVLQLLSSS